MRLKFRKVERWLMSNALHLGQSSQNRHCGADEEDKARFDAICLEVETASTNGGIKDRPYVVAIPRWVPSLSSSEWADLS